MPIERAPALYIPPTLTGPSPGAITGTFNDVAQGLSAVGQRVEQIRAHQQALLDNVDVANAVAGYSKALTEQRIHLETDPDPRTHAERFGVFSNQKREEFLSTLGNDETRSDFLSRAAGIEESNGVSVFHYAEKMRIDQAQAQSFTRRQNFLFSMVNAGNEVTRAQLDDLLTEDIDRDPNMTPTEKVKAKSDFRGQFEEARVLQGIRAVDLANGQDGALFAAKTTLHLIDESVEMSPVERERLKTQVTNQYQTALSRLQTEGNRADRQASDGAATRLYTGIHSEDPTQRPTEVDIWNNPALRGPTIKGVLVTELRRVAKDEKIARNSNTQMQAWFDVLDGKITEAGQLVPLIGKMEPGELHTLTNKIESLKKSGQESRELEKEAAAFQRLAVRGITSTDMGQAVPALSITRAQDFISDFRDAWDNAPPEERLKLIRGKNRFNWENYHVTGDEAMNYQMLNIPGADAPPSERPGVGAAAAPVTDNPKSRLPGESAADYGKRMDALEAAP